MMLQLVRFFLLLAVFAGMSAADCPDKCECDGIVADCTNSNIFEIPRNIPKTTKTLILRNNRIRRIARSALKHLEHLEVLILTNNRIFEIQENFLDDMPNLRRFSIAKNWLYFIPPLASVPHTLASLNLKYNKIKTIDPEAFENLHKLQQLDISHNLLQSLPTTSLQNLNLLDNFDLHHNPWNCDCRLPPIASASRTTKSERAAFCTNPKQIRHLPLHQVYETNVHCETPEIEEHVGNNLKLTCKSNGKNITWLYKYIELSSSALDAFTLSQNDLIVPKTTPIKFISCTSDYLDIPHHRRVRHLARTIKFTYKPRDNSYREGSEVKVNCEVIGEPKPKIKWYYDGKLLTSTRKRQLSLSNNILRIYPFLEEDAGRYTCEASNEFETIRHDFNLELISSVPPNIYQGPESKTANVGGQVKFVCKARGTPIPDYTWSFDGSTIGHIKGRIMVSDDGTELTISNIEKKDEGFYSCMAGNPVGAMSSDAKLTVIGDSKSGEKFELTDDALEGIVKKARENVERAVEKTRVQLTQDRVTNTQDLKRLFRFSVPKQAVELSKAREIYEESVRLVREHVNRGLMLDIDELHPKNISYESVLHVTHMQTLMGMSGCHSGQFKNPCTDVCFHNKYRSFDGQCNNWKNPMYGVSFMPLKRLLKPVYENGFNTPVGWDPKKLYHGYPMPNVREVSRQLVATERITPHSKLSAMVMQWGQFLDHDLTHSVSALSRHSYSTGAFCNRTCENIDPCFNIQLPKNDPRLKGGNVKYPCIEFERSAAVCGSGETSLLFNRVTYREQMNGLTSFIDASTVYGSTEVQAQELRDTYNNKGTLRYDITSDAGKEYMPFEKDSNMDCRRNFSESNPIRCFLAGDLRANEQLALVSTHTIFLREHNRIATELLSMNRNWDGEVIYYETRKIVGAIVQHITYEHWLPHVFGGKDQLMKYIGTYKGYDDKIDASISNAFATAAFRFGHTLINPTLFRLNNDFSPISDGHIPLHKNHLKFRIFWAFFTPELVLSQGGIDPLLRGLFASPLKHPMPTQLLNMELIEKLFMKGHEVALDLAVMNIQRSRDHGLPSYTAYREFCNLTVPRDWSDMKDYIRDESVLKKLQGLYGVPQNIDLWVGGIVEEKLENALFGPTFACIIGDQFKRLRDGDRHWYEKEGMFTKEQLREIKKVTLARILCDNGDMIDRVQKDVFLYPGKDILSYNRCSDHPKMDLREWRNCCDNVCPTMLDRILRSRHRGSRLHGCTVEGIWRPEGAKWIPRNEYCTECVCQGSRVWCSIKEDCSDNRSPF
ncbi:unnamed protein product [Caenorhabditis bovis]|uniref:Ig-like domain-containing protein n=1 Tax=Caenorhabditis bovis TaxID=2654633 RepID=A0A8S1EG12_9PELO|nr:unnamed protein product [Caenorhabditis bovis]